MSTTANDFLFQVDPPWIYIGPGEDEQRVWTPSHFFSKSGMRVCVRRLRGKKMRTTEGLMNEIAAALQFFGGFGENWHALKECLDYLDEWLPADAYILVVEDADVLLDGEEPSELASLLKVLDAAGDFWSRPVVDNDRFNRPPVPFHVLLTLPATASASEVRLTGIAREAHVPYRD